MEYYEMYDTGDDFARTLLELPGHFAPDRIIFPDECPVVSPGLRAALRDRFGDALEDHLLEE